MASMDRASEIKKKDQSTYWGHQIPELNGMCILWYLWVRLMK